MEFIEFITSAQLIYKEFWQQIFFAAIIFIGFFAFQAIALFVIAKREGYKHCWMAFVPILSTYYMGVCSQKNKVGSFSTKKFAIIVAVVELVAVASYLLYFVSESLVTDFLVDIVYATPYEFLPVQIITDYSYSPLLPSNLIWATYVYDYANFFISFIDLAYYVLNFILLISFFKTYAPRNYYLFALVSIFLPLKGVFAFVVRNNKGKSYADYIRDERERQYYIRQQYYQQNFNNNPYGNGPSRGNGYGYTSHDEYYNQNGYNQNRSAHSEDPFGDFNSNGGYNNGYNGNNNGYNGANGNAQKAPPPEDPFEDFN
ncbi:MAG: hypothetical protein E7370_05700 [Clostridiales bacterium]|nr:hypothetical protein [Clostridiales bacterium]